MDNLSGSNLSFSKKPICGHPQKRHSVMSDILVNQHSDNNNTNNNNNYTLNKERHSNRTFSTTSELIDADQPLDDPLLDYDEQIRAPKFQNKKSVEDIGSFPVEEQQKQATSNILNPQPDSTTKPSKSNYQPAKVDISLTTRRSSLPEYQQTTSTSLAAGLYTIEQYLINSNNTLQNYPESSDCISEDTSSTAKTSPISSKKPSAESISFMNRKNVPITMKPLRQIKDPKTPNYIPCVLRPTEHSPGLSQIPDEDLYEEKKNESSNDSCVSKDHWKPNSTSSRCFDCNRTFSMINRRHHCRKCGEIFCSNCLLSKAKLNFNCQFDMNGAISKVCFQCGKNWSLFLIDNLKQSDPNLYPNFKNSNNDAGLRDQLLENENKTGVITDWFQSSF